MPGQSQFWERPCPAQRPQEEASAASPGGGLAALGSPWWTLQGEEGEKREKLPTPGINNRAVDLGSEEGRRGKRGSEREVRRERWCWGGLGFKVLCEKQVNNSMCTDPPDDSAFLGLLRVSISLPFGFPYYSVFLLLSTMLRLSRFSARVPSYAVRWNSTGPTLPPLMSTLRTDLKTAMRAKDTSR